MEACSVRMGGRVPCRGREAPQCALPAVSRGRRSLSSATAAGDAYVSSSWLFAAIIDARRSSGRSLLSMPNGSSISSAMSSRLAST